LYTHIPDGFCQRMHHALAVQVFQPDELVFFNQLAVDLLMKVTARVGHPFIQPIF